MIVHTQKIMPILSSVLVLIGFPDLVCQDQPRGAPSVDAPTLGLKTLHKLSSLKYCYNTCSLQTNRTSSSSSSSSSSSLSFRFLDRVMYRDDEEEDGGERRGGTAVMETEGVDWITTAPAPAG